MPMTCLLVECLHEETPATIPVVRGRGHTWVRGATHAGYPCGIGELMAIRARLYPPAAQEAALLEHCAHARYVWNLAWNLYQFGTLETYGGASRRVREDG